MYLCVAHIIQKGPKKQMKNNNNKKTTTEKHTINSRLFCVLIVNRYNNIELKLE